MPKSTTYTLVSIDDKGDPRVEEFDMFAALEIRMGGIQSNDPQYRLLVNGAQVAWDWSNPKLNINGLEGAPAAKKPRAKRRSSAEVAAEKQAKAEAKKAPTLARDAPHTRATAEDRS